MGGKPTHHQTARRAEKSPPATKREEVIRYDLRVSLTAHAEIVNEAAKTGESPYAVACRWLEERGRRGWTKRSKRKTRVVTYEPKGGEDVASESKSVSISPRRQW